MERDHGDGHTYTLARIKEIRSIHKREVTSVAEAAKNLRDEANIYADILPGYKIKELTEDEKSVMRSKEVRSLQSVEQTILFYYRKFLGNLVALAHKKSDDTQFMAVSCLCEILPMAQDFNYGSAVIDVIVDRANSRVPKLANMCITAIRELLSCPTPSEAILSCLQCISTSVKDRGYLVSHRLVASLMCVRIKIMDVNSRDIIKEKKIKKQQKKDDKALAKQVEKGEAHMSRLEQSKLQTDMLNKVITTYLRTLEICKKAPRYRQSLLLGPVMEGLAKFAHLIDFSLFELLLEAISDVLASPTTTTAAVLNGVITVATLAQQAQESGDSLAVDIAQYYETLYVTMLDALDVSSMHDARSKIDVDAQDAEGGADDATTAVSMIAPRGKRTDPPRNTLKERTDRAGLVLKACNLMLLAPKKVPFKRVAAFYRRIGLCALHTPPNIALGLLSFNHKLLQKYPQLAVLHDGAEEAAGGAYDWEIETPDHVNAMASVGWEAPLLRKSFHPFLGQYAGTLLRQYKGLANNTQKMASLTQTVMGFSYEKGVKQYDASGGGFTPLPLEINKKMDRAVLKRRQEAALAMTEAEQEAQKPKKKKKVPTAAIESA
eukprot:TRINITY_DN24122_c0_g1_i1.p1 TRINITY_DN24122_c0_g1~~TRINITY_DN24122_c0_g1_i1.p1  ORF type:complete len:605 (+),score=240.06 TRINITY_DN24122_c0_g1_i1:34-1848(+)